MEKPYTRIVLLTLVIVFMTFIYIFFISESKSKAIAFAVKGKIDFKNWQWDKNEIAQLKGEWSFYPDLLKEDIKADNMPKFEKVPGSWEDYKDVQLSPYGFGTYKLNVSGLKPLSVYGVELPDQVTAYNLFANNKKIASNGVVSNKYENYKPCWNPTTAVFQTDKHGKVEFVMEIANFDYATGGFWNSIKIGEFKDILFYGNKNRITDIFIFSTIFIIGLFSLGLFIIYRKDKTTLYFSVLCFINAIRNLLVDQRLISDIFVNLNWNVLVRLEFFTAYTILPIWGLYIVHLFKIKKYSIYIQYFFYSYILLAFVLTSVMPNRIYYSFIEPNKWLGIVMATYFLFCIIRANVYRQEGADLIAFGVVVIVISIIKETFVRGPVSWLPFAVLNFVICCFLTTLKQFLNIIRKNDILQEKVILDPLTGLHNRAYLNKIGKSFFTNHKSENKYIMFLDLDRFKYVNDTFGHKVGDFVLQGVGIRLKDVLNDNHIICRYGGDEFILIVIAKNDSEIERIANSIIKKIKEPFIKDKNSYNIGVSIGIAKSSESSDNIEILIKNSDKAMYIAKKNGGNQYFLWE